MKKDYIIVIDSGIGGLSTLSECIKKTNQNYIYIADNKNIPYGSHTADEIKQFLCEILLKLKKKCSFKIVLLACNTATTSSIVWLRKRFKNLIFIGTEPAINVAVNLSYKKVLVLTTPTTANQIKFKNLLKNQHSKIDVLSIESLANDIEVHLKKHTYFSYAKLLKDVIYISKTCKNYDCIVLGCTHYVLIKNLLQKFTNIALVDGNIGVSTQLAKQACNLGIKPIKQYNIKFINTLGLRCVNQNNKKILSQILANKEIL